MNPMYCLFFQGAGQTVVTGQGMPVQMMLLFQASSAAPIIVTTLIIVTKGPGGKA